MNPSDTTATMATIKNLWPRARRTDAEWKVLFDRILRVGIDHEQAVAALENLMATSEKYPNVAVILKALQYAAPQVDDAKIAEVVLSRADFMRKLLAATGIVVGDDSEVLRAYWLDGLHATMRMRGDIPPHYQDEFKADAAACHVGQTEADDVWDWLISQVVEVELDERANKMWKSGMALREMMGRADSNSRGDGKLMPKSRNAQKRDWIARRIQIHEVLAAQEVA